MKWFLAIAVLLLIVGVIGWRRYFATYHLETVVDGVLYRDGVRSPREFESAVRKVHPKTVVRLIDANEQKQEPFLSEAAHCRAQGIEIIELPIELGGWPRPEQIDEFLRIAADPKRQPVLVHCAQGVRRTGMMVAAYQESVLGYDPTKAKAAILSFGHSQRTIGDVTKFIDVYEPKQRTLPT